MPRNAFSELTGDGSGKVSNLRRVSHSFTDYFRSIDRSSIGLQNVGAGINGVNVAAGVGGAVKSGLSLSKFAAGAVAASGILAACAGPQAAITASAISLCFLVKSTYSNREAAHRILRPYVWSIVDDHPPASFNTIEELQKVAQAAQALLDDGKNQYKLVGIKFQKAAAEFAELNREIDEMATRLIRELHAAPFRGNPVAIAALEKYMESVWEKESKPGGRIFNFVRRCEHTSNYLQAPHLVAHAMRAQFDPMTVLAEVQIDYFAHSPSLQRQRKAFLDLETAYRGMLVLAPGLL